MHRRSLFRTLAAVASLAALGLTPGSAQAYYYYFQYRFSYFVHRTRRRTRWRRR
jgi:hypothetical protein